MLKRVLCYESGIAVRKFSYAGGFYLLQQMPRRGNACCEPALRKDPLDKLETDMEVDWFAALIRKCTTGKILSSVYNRIVREGYGGSVYLSNLVVQMYGRCGNIREARSVFDRIRPRNLFSWNIMISAYAQKGYPQEAIELYKKMDIRANGMTFTSILSACAALGDLTLGQEVHACMLSTGVSSSVILDTALMNMYARCGRPEVAREVFDRIPRKTVVSWNSLIAAYAQIGHPQQALELYERMLTQDVQPDRVTFVSVLNACTELPALVRVHDKIRELGVQSDVVVSTSLVNMYSKCGKLETARRVFDSIEKRNVISWNAMLTAYANQGESSNTREVGELYPLMDLEGVAPDSITFATVLGACGDVDEGGRIHADAKTVLPSPRERAILETAVVRMYARLGQMDLARKVFEQIELKDLVAWNAMIAASVQASEWKLAIEFFNRMVLESSVRGDKTTFTSVLSACSSLGALQLGEEIHDKFIRGRELERDLGVQNGLLNLYAKCGNVKHAREVMEAMEERDEVSMNVMIAAYAQQGHGREAIRMFREMDLEGIPPDGTTFASVVTACSSSGALALGKKLHERILSKERKVLLLPNVVLETALLSMYGKCGTLGQAKAVFQSMHEKNLITWNAVLGACAHQGDSDEALETLRVAALDGVQLDSTSFISALIACSHAGKLEIAYDCFMLIVAEYDLQPVAENYRCMVDLLARSGKLAEAEELMRAMPFEPDAIAWRTFLAACRVQGSWDERIGAVAEEAFKLDPDNTAPYILLSGIYSAAGKQEELVELRSGMKDRAIKKLVPGKSSIEIHGRVYEFVAGDTSHPQNGEIIAELEALNVEMKKLGYVPSVELVGHDIREQEKEGILGLHSEKLALGLGLLLTKARTPLLVLKNLRICSDCHAAVKFISRAREREITVRDANRFHRFVDGSCSCGDYW